jgi:small-conductance mechanosensitive channel
VKARRNEHPTIRAFAIILAIVCVIVIFQLNATLVVAAALLQIAFFLAIAFFLFLFWRERRGEIALWPVRAQWAFYGAVFVLLANLGLYFGARLFRAHGLTINGWTGAAWLLVFPLCAYTIWRVWRDQHTYH